MFNPFSVRGGDKVEKLRGAYGFFQRGGGAKFDAWDKKFCVLVNCLTLLCYGGQGKIFFLKSTNKVIFMYFKPVSRIFWQLHTIVPPPGPLSEL